MGSVSAQDQCRSHHAAVPNPCRISGEKLNTSTLPDATSLSLYSYSDSQQTTHRNISAAEPYMYLHDVQVVKVIPTILHNEIFNGSCMTYKDNDRY
jgi:Zn-dependent alcohol dehydrogenase